MASRRNNTSDNLLYAALAGIGIVAAATAAVRWSRRFDFRGKVVLITGGSRGLGIVLARQFAQQGARLAICARDPQELTRAVDDLAGRGAEVLALPCDICSHDDVARMVAEVDRHYGSVDVLVNNAGTIAVGPIETMTLADFEEAMRTHFWGPLYTTMAVLPYLRRSGGGRIVNISSIGGKIAVPHLVPYSASKFALAGFSEGLRAELQKDNIYVTSVFPGLMRTGSAENAFFKGRHREEHAWFHVSDATPGFSMSAERAARQIVCACRYGRAEIVLSLPAKVATTLHAVFPGLSTQIAGMVNEYALPAPGGIGELRARGHQSETPVTRSWVTRLSRGAAAANNERPPFDVPSTAGRSRSESPAWTGGARGPQR
jgi:NAD(P)-dependent dehydrogenase (short-subunit alcohol dehydrogenase family)